MMTTLDYSPIEALVFHNLSFLISSLSSNLWAWLAAVTVAVTYLWSIKATSSPPLCARAAEKNNADDAHDQMVITTPTLAPPSVKFTATYDDTCFMTRATQKTSVVVVYEPIGGGDDDRERFCGGGDNWLCDEHVVGTRIAAETASLITFSEANFIEEFNLESFSGRRRRRTIKGEDYCYDLYWKGILRMRNGDSIGRCHDSIATRSLDGNIVKYWEQ